MKQRIVTLFNRNKQNKQLFRLFFGLLGTWGSIVLMICSFTVNLHAVQLMKVSEIKAGMKGEGKTIFKGTQIETFPFTILGIMDGISPGKSMIIFEAESPVLQEAGIIEGMSGSPAYIDGKLIGAIAFGFSFTKKPIGGITPIDDMLKANEFNHTAANLAVDLSDIKLEFDKKNVGMISDRIRKEISNRINFSPASSFSPIRLIGSSRGMNKSVLSDMNGLFSILDQNGSSGFRTMSGISAQSRSADTKSKPVFDTKLAEKNLLKLNPADSVSVALITGDFEFSALGTVTHVDGNNVYMFGHPFFNMGTVDFPMHRSEVISVLPSYQSSFKMGVTKNMVGHVIQDRSSCVQGELGKVPYMIPMKVYMKDRNRTFNLELANHPLLTPALVGYAMSNIFSSELQESGFQSIDVDGKIYIEGEKNIIINDIFSGTDSFANFSNLLMAINFFLLNNKEKSIKIQKIDLEINSSEAVKIADIESVILDKKSYTSGEAMNIVVYLKNEKGKPFKEEITLPAPNLKPGSEFFLMLADGEEMSLFDSKNVRSNFFPSKLSHIIRAINNIRRNKQVYVKVMTAEGGLFVKGYEYPKLPSSLQDVFTYDKSQVYESASESQSSIRYSTIYEYQTEIPGVVRGSKLFKLKINERSDEK